MVTIIIITTTTRTEEEEEVEKMNDRNVWFKKAGQNTCVTTDILFSPTLRLNNN
jgi:hypothetical protein